MGNSDSETELKRKKEKKHKDKDSGDERKERRDREKEEKKAKTDKGKEERKEKKDKEKEHGDKEDKKEKKDKGKEEKKDKKGETKEKKEGKKDKKEDKEDKGKDKEKDEKKKRKEGKCHDDKDKPSRPSGSACHASSGPIDAHDGEAAGHYKSSGAPIQPPQSGEIPWFLREPGTVPDHQKPSQTEPNFPIQPTPPQHSIHPSSQQQPFRAVGEVGGPPSTQNVPPSGHRVPLSPNDHFPTPDRLGRPPATDSDGSTPVYIGSAIFPNSVHPCRIVPSLNPPCRVLHGGSEVEHHGRYDLLPVTQDMEWIPSKHGELPPGRRPVEGGYEPNGNKLYHALGSVQGVYVPGKAGQHLMGAIIPFEGNERHVQENYSILCWK